jgi:hypothetical protein
MNDSVTAPPTSDYFSGDEWTSVWGIQSWNNSGTMKKPGVDARVLLVNSPNNVFIENNTDNKASSRTFLTMRTKRLPGFQSAAEFESISGGYKFLSVRMYARTIGSPGACTAMFTYRQSDKLSDVQEADLEVLTKDPRNVIQYTNQPSYTIQGDSIDGSTQNATLPNNLQWSDWAVHRLDWEPKKTTWYINGQQVASLGFQVPRDDSRVIFNAWSDGGSWTGSMNVFDETYFQMQWVEMVYNTTDSVNRRDQLSPRNHDDGPNGRLVRRNGKGKCKVICSIDAGPITGQAVMIHNSSTPARLLVDGEGLGYLGVFVPTIVMLAMLVSSLSLL